MAEKNLYDFMNEEDCCAEQFREALYQRGLRLCEEGNDKEAAACFRQAAENVLDALEEGMGSVGTQMCVKHVSIKHCYAVSAQQTLAVIIIIVIVTIFWCAEVEPHACPEPCSCS